MEELSPEVLDAIYADELSEGIVVDRSHTLADEDAAHGRRPVGANEQLDTTLIDSQFGDRVLFEAQLLVADEGPCDLAHLIRVVVEHTGKDERHVRNTLRQHKTRFTKLADGQLTLSEDALR